ncbi:uncharacterized protein B0H64DRAFT_393737 [Chaetomium fimeti]|uniref:Uncharacterized protein n=1 Tax=Chaetomium fimeti TaxID=1854472 RepID=A0AAE0HK61_9PEZI|nr:hypothetical protein B0H64DRAFT_393737 [Chaetomium fimeti]
MPSEEDGRFVLLCLASSVPARSGAMAASPPGDPCSAHAIAQSEFLGPKSVADWSVSNEMRFSHLSHSIDFAFVPVLIAPIMFNKVSKEETL